MRPRHLRRPMLAVALVVPAMFAAGPAVHAHPDGHPSYFAVDWGECPESTDTVECGTLEVPLDWSDDDGEEITVAVARRAADNPAASLGTLFYNPGGPGDGGVKYVLAAEQFFSDTLRERFDIVAMDPRGVGGSTPVVCSLPAVTPESTLWPRTEDEFEALKAHNRALGESCLAETGPLLGHVDTRSVARDHDALRRALHVRQVSWLGLSYGTQLAANYADLFPRRTRALALDAALEHSLPEVVQVADEARAAEDSFERFVEWCAVDEACVLRGQDVAALYDELVAATDRAPVPVEGALAPVRGEDIRMGTISLLRFRQPSVIAPELSWAVLGQVLSAAFAGDVSAFAFPADAPQMGLHQQAGIGCMEYAPQVHTWEEMRQRMELGRRVAPHLQGASETWRVLGCIDWPIDAGNPPRTLDVEDVPALLVHATFDPSVPYKWAHSLAAQIEGSHLLTREGDGHTSYYTSPCAQEEIDAFLVDLAPPQREVCD